MVRYAPASHSAVALGVAAALASFNVYSADAAQGETLEPIVVTATRATASAFTSPSALTVITAEDIKRAGVTSVFEAIRKVGGFAGKLDLSNGGNDKIDLRGFGDAAGSNTVLLINGVRVSETDLSSTRLSGIPIELVDRIEVVRGGASVLWGEGATSGVVNVVLKERKALRGQFASTVGAGLDSLGGYDLHASTTATVGELVVDASTRHSSGVGYRANAQSRNDIYSAGVFWSRGAFSEQLRVIHDDQYSQWPGNLSFEEFAQNPRQSTQANQSGRTKETRLISNTLWQDGPLSAQLDLGSRYRHYRSANWGGTVGNQQVSPKVAYEWDLAGSKFVQTVGLDYQHWKRGMPSGFSPIEGHQTNRAAYAFSDVMLASGTRINAGVRRELLRKREASSYSSYDRADAVNAGEFGVSQILSAQWQAYARAAKSFRLANFDENGSTPDGKPLLPQTSQDREVGVRWASGPAAFNARVFRQNTVNEILYLDFTPFDFDYCCNRNLDPVRRQGLELDGKAPVTDRLSVSASIQALSAKFTAGAYQGKQRVLVSPRTATARVHYKMDDLQSVFLGGQYLSSSRFSDDFDNTCATRIPAQVTMDAGYNFDKDGWRMGLVISNLMDKPSYSYAYVCNYGALYPNDGRVIRASLSKQF